MSESEGEGGCGDVDWGQETEEEAVGSLVVWREVEKGYR